MFKRLQDLPPPPTMPSYIIGITGHRPHKLPNPHTGYDWHNPTRVRLREEINQATRALIARHDRLIAERQDDRIRNGYLGTLLKDAVWRTPIPTHVLGVTGMALGIDQDAAGEWHRMGVHFLALVPFPGQESLWKKDDQTRYHRILKEAAAGVVYVSKHPPGKDKALAVRQLHERNNALAMLVDDLIGVWDGSPGGTRSCIANYEYTTRKQTYRIHPQEEHLPGFYR